MSDILNEVSCDMLLTTQQLIRVADLMGCLKPVAKKISLFSKY